MSMLRRVTTVVALLVVNEVLSCRWVCIDKKNNIRKEYFDSDKLHLEFQNNVIKVPKISKKLQTYKENDLPDVILRMPEFHVDPVQVSCHSKEFTKRVGEMTRKISCLPRDTIVDLKYKGAKVTPRQVSTKLCTGVCSGSKTCVSIDRKNVSVAISVFDNRNRPQCTSVMIPEDTKCKCGCNKSENDCKPTQVFDKKFCKCKCINKDEHSQCISKMKLNVDKFMWNKEFCSCQCKQEFVCSTGTTWNKNDCRCVRKI